MNKESRQIHGISRDKILLEALVKRKLLDPARARSLLATLQARTNKDTLEELLMKNGWVRESDYLDTQVAIWNIPSVSLHDHIVDAEVLNLVPAETARQYTIFPLFKIDNELFLAMSDPKDVESLDRVSELTQLIVKPTLASRKAIQNAIHQYYGTDETIHISHQNDMQEILEVIESEEPDYKEDVSLSQLQKMTEEAPVVKMTGMILNQALLEKASDIHITPEDNQLRVRFRVDGMLKESFNLPRHLQYAIISRIKVLAHLDISEHRIPQDGQFSLKLRDGRSITIRVSSLPINHGEDMVLRILDKDASLLQLENLGCEASTLKRMNHLLTNAYGMILVTGPTGSGKTTTLYACLNKLSNNKKNIITLEDPIEYNLPGIRQSQVHHKSGMTFARGLRSILRHDPDIIMVGEIRDSETANIAIQSAMTGHLVLSTLHTNDAASAVSRLLEMQIEPYLLASALLGVQAQRLVRRLCPKCRQPHEPDYTPFLKMLDDLKLNHTGPPEVFKAKGCEQCHYTGYSGRISIMEVLPVQESVKKLICSSVSADIIQKEAIEQGMQPLLYDGWRKVFQGISTIEEILRVINLN